MTPAPSPDVLVTPLPSGGARYRLPRRADLTPRLLSAAALALVLLVPLAVPLVFIPREQLFVVLVAALGMLGTAVGVALWALADGPRIAPDPSELILDNSGLQTLVQVGPFRRTRRVPLARVDCLLLQPGLPEDAELLVVCFQADPLRVAGGLPREALRSLAHDLAGRIAALDPRRGGPVEVREGVADGRETLPPPGSRIIVADQDGGVVFTVPPGGLRGGNAAFAAFGAVYLAGGLVYLFAWLYDVATGRRNIRGLDDVGPMTQPLLSWAFGLLWLSFALKAGQRRVILTVRDGALRVEQHGVFGESEHCWARDEVEDVGAEGRGLVIQPVRGKTFTLPDVARLRGGAGEAECRWLASALREALGLDETTPPGGVCPGRAPPPTP